MRVAASVLATLLVVLCTSVLLDLSWINVQRRISEKLDKRKYSTDEKSTEKKGYLYIHVGPSKTATTTLQTDLTKFEKVLEKENHYYLGRWYEYNEKGNLHQRLQSETLQALEPALDHRHTACTLSPLSDCLWDFKTKLADESYNRTIAHNQQQQDASELSATPTFVLSSERLSNVWKSPEDYQAIRDALIENWDVTIVVSYRRFYSFIRSSKFQRDRLDRHDGRTGKKSLWPKDGGKHVNGYFEKNGQLRKFHVFTDTAVENAKNYLPVKIFHPFNYDTTSDASTNSTESILTKFLCNILPDANDSCSLSRENDANATSNILNPRTDEDDLLYDTIATKAADADLVDTTIYSRTEVRKALRRFNEEELQQGIIDLDLDCPSNLQLQSFLEQSLMFESKYAPDLFKDPRNIEKHRADFHKLVEKRAFCWVDTDKILERTQWKDFFASNFARPPQTNGTNRL